MRKGLGCFTFTGIVAATLTLLAIVFAHFERGGMLFSPGALNADSRGQALGGVFSHSQIGGQCQACHTAPWDQATMADRCMVCHTTIRAELANGKSLHGIFLEARPPASLGFQMFSIGLALTGNAAPPPTLQCNACHPDHRGAHASLLEVQPADFPHDNLHFSLRAHRRKADSTPFVCQDCHQTRFTGPFEMATCVNCHFAMQADFTQKHALDFGLECLNCHDGKESLGSHFDHSRVPFKLTGQHAQAECTACHQQTHTLAALQSTPQDCFACHGGKDPHQGRFSADCASCHTPEGWKPAKFDHNLAAFKLEGKHASVACEQCHVNGIYQNGVLQPVSQDCFSCHAQKDVHAGQLGNQCQQCHNPSAWNQVTFDHSRAAFPLTGAHVNLACERCHADKTFKNTPQECVACHRQDDKHGGKFGTQCQICHTTSTWKGATFDHNLAAFKLTGAHVSVACEQCHVNGVFKGTPKDCYSCHRQNDKHNGQFGTNCASCHNTSSWKGATFDHNLAAFKLTGAHVSVACERCHVNGVFKGTPKDCYSCHRQDDHHNGQFGTNCASCHNTSSWKGATFDHNNTRFPLTGAHVNLNCSRCHANGFKGTPTACVACHAEPAFHRGAFGTNCASCHNTSAWRPASFNGPHTFPLKHGGAKASCSTCHPNSLTAYTCYGCHEHDPAKIRKKHLEKGIPNFENCIQCHPTGKKD